MTDRKYDVVLFGATGFTGGLTAEYLARVQAATPFSWAIAGRNRQKLEEVQARVHALGARVDLLGADSGDEASLRSMARTTRVVITTVGPYIRYGEPLVQACIEEATDYVDLTGEPMFVDRMLARHHARAEARRVKIVNTCGFDSIPHDLGAYFAVHALRKKLGSLAQRDVEVTGLVRASGSFSGGTWHSAINAMANAREHARLRASGVDARPQVGADRSVSQLPPRVHYEKQVAAWAVPLPTIDPEVVCRSARLYPEYGKRFRYGHFLALPHLPAVAMTALGAGTVFSLAQLSLTRSLLLKIKDPGEGPSEQTRAQGWFEVTLLASADSTQVVCKVTGGDPGYGDTAKMLAESALCLALKRQALPEHYGVVPPAAAMGDVLIERLRASGMGFEQV
ncbi:MAG: saccharopine dehydrogenase NADP-binding domain-containing protein [Myxococcales bacterium]